MPKTRTGAEVAAGMLVSAVQKEWGSELGTSAAGTTEHVLSLAHELLRATKAGNLNSALSSATVPSSWESYGSCVTQQFSPQSKDLNPL